MNLLNEVPIIRDKKELKPYIKPLYVIYDYMESNDKYTNFVEKLYNTIKGCYEHKECREYPITFKFYLSDKKTHTLEFRHFIINLFLWNSFVSLYGIKGVLDESFIFDCSQAQLVNDYVNEKIISVLRDYNIKNTVINYSVSDTLYNIRRISIDFSIILNLSINTESFIDLYKNNPRIREIMNTQFSNDIQPADLEAQLEKLMNEEIDIYKSIKDNHVGVILRSGTGIKPKQFSEFTINGGLQPSLTGETIPIPINSNTMIKGLSKPSLHFIGANGARKSLVMNKKVMGKAGYFGKIVLLLARTLKLSKTVSDCGTTHLLRIYIANKKILNKYDSRYYKLEDSNDSELLLLNAKKDNHLIGKTVYFRSPTKCACGNDEVCHKCFGMTSLLNLDISEGVSGFEAEEVTKVVNQMILSTKHLLTTISEKIEFNEAFDSFFTLTAGEINPNLSNSDVDDLDNYAIYINPEDIKRVEDMDSDSSFNTYIQGKFYIKNMKTNENIEICCNDPDKELYFTDESITLMKKGKGLIKFKDLSEEDTIFEIIIMNNELTKPLYVLMDLLNKGSKSEDDDIENTIDGMCQKFTELLIESKIKATALAGELIINRLIRKDPDTDYKRPDFREEEMPPYKIYTVSKALERNPSPLIGLSYQNLKRQLLSDDIIDIKNGTSYLDPFFKKKLSSKYLYKNNKKIK